MRIHFGKVCVYTHSIDGAVFYVGMGVACRPFEAARRNAKWTNVVGAAGSFDVDIVKWCENQIEARMIEARIIVQYKPVANFMQNGFRQTDRQKASARLAHLGKKVSEATRAKMSAARLGIAPWNKGKHTSEHQKAILSAQARGKIRVIDVGSGQQFQSVRAASQSLGIPKSTLLQHLAGRLRHARGRTFVRELS